MSFEWLIVGGGIHGTYIARALLRAGIPREEIAVVDQRGEFLGAFKEKARACGMESLRSTFVQHIGSDPFGLETFAEGHDREGELHPTPNHPPRPSLALFLDHAEHVIDRSGLEEVLIERTVTGLEREADTVRVRTTEGPLRADNIVLAVGPGDRYRRPTWAEKRPSIEHVWDDETRPTDRVDRGERVLVIGGSVTAGQFATSVSEIAEHVTLCVRHPIREATAEADPRWINWRYIERELHGLPPGSKARYDRVHEARNDGTMPEYLTKQIRETPNIDIRRGEVITATANGKITLRFGAGSVESADRVILATGFRPAYDRPLVGAIADSLNLERGYRGVPILGDETMAWRTHGGSPSNVFVTGHLAACTAGPLAGNIHGARRAAERIVPGNVGRIVQRA